jgi:hypothetical protein
MQLLFPVSWRAALAVNIWIFITISFLITGCASRSYQGADVDAGSFLQRSVTQEQGPIRVTAAVPDASETQALTGLNLYDQGIQPIWLEVENRSSEDVHIANWSIDRNYFSPIEVAYMNRKKFSSQGYAEMERWFYENGLQRLVPAGATRTGIVFTNLKPGTKAFNLDIFSSNKANSFTFFVPMPGFTPDYMNVNFEQMYKEEEIRNLDEAQLRTVLEKELSCCGTDAIGEEAGSPLNIVLVGSALAVRRTMMRGEWQETEAGWQQTATGLQETEAGLRDNATLRDQYFRGRQPDGVYYIDRADGNERIQLRLWLAPWRVNSQPVWVGQTFYYSNDDSFWGGLADQEQFKDSKFLAAFMEESVVADVDGARNYIMQNFWYSQSLQKMGMVGGMDKTTVKQPGTTFDGIGYFSKGLRAILFLSESPLGLDDIELVY